MAPNEEKKVDSFEIGVAHLLARKNILSLHPYRCARDDYSSGILLDANENSLGPTSVPSNSIDPYDNHLCLERYPDPYQFNVKKLYADYRGEGLRPSQIFCGVGSDEAIDLLFRIFCIPGVDFVMTTPPTYGMYKVCATVNDVGIINVPLCPDFNLRIPEMLNALTDRVKLMFICSPGNPTAKAIPLSDIEIIANSSYRGLIVVDEAYVDFSPLGSSVSLLSKYPNIVVLQTLSKAFGLAGIRMGFALANEDVIQLMNNVKAPYNINSLTAEVAINALNNISTFNKNTQEILKQKAIVADRLVCFDFVSKIFQSDSNFLLFRVKAHAQKMYKMMANDGVVTRYRGNEMHCDECIRVTIGTAEENELFLKKLQEVWVIANER